MMTLQYYHQFETLTTKRVIISTQDQKQSTLLSRVVFFLVCMQSGEAESEVKCTNRFTIAKDE